MIKDPPPTDRTDRPEPLIARPAVPATGAGSGAGDNVVDLLKELAGQGSHLAEQQLALIKAEIRESTADLKAAAGATAGAAVVGLAGLGVVLMGLAYLLADAIEDLGLATLIVGLAALAVAYVLYASGTKKLRETHLAPERTQRTLQRTPDAVRGDLQTEHTR